MQSPWSSFVFQTSFNLNILTITVPGHNFAPVKELLMHYLHISTQACHLATLSLLLQTILKRLSKQSPEGSWVSFPQMTRQTGKMQPINQQTCFEMSQLDRVMSQLDRVMSQSDRVFIHAALQTLQYAYTHRSSYLHAELKSLMNIALELMSRSCSAVCVELSAG